MKMEEKDLDTSAGTLRGYYREPTGTNAMVVLLHDAGSSRESRRDQAVARELWKGGIGTFLPDLLTVEEREEHPEGLFDLEMQTRRVVEVVDALRDDAVGALRVGLVGSGTGAATALNVAAREGSGIEAVVSWSGRPDLLGDGFDDPGVPTLFIVGERDRESLQRSKEALNRFGEDGAGKLEVIPEVSGSFDDPGSLVLMAQRSLSWLEEHLVKGVAYTPPEAPGDRGTEPEQ